MLATDIMTSDPASVVPSDRIGYAAGLMRDRDVGAVPVVRDRGSMQVVGILTDRDIVIRCVASGHPRDCRVRDHMTGVPLVTAKLDADVHELLAYMERRQVRRVPIVEPDGRLVGIVAQADVALRLGPQEPIAIERLLDRLSEPTAVCSVTTPGVER